MEGEDAEDLELEEEVRDEGEGDLEFVDREWTLEVEELRYFYRAGT